MEFSRVGKHTIKCVISEEEIQDLGFSVEEIVTNSERTQEFMNHIFDMAEQEFETKFEMGVKTVQVEFRSDHTLSLTFSEHPASEGMMSHLKDIVCGLLNNIPQEKWEEYKQKQDQEENNSLSNVSADGEEPDIIVLIKFRALDTVLRFAKQIQLENLPVSMLGKCRNEFYLVMDLSHNSEEEVRRLSVLADEYAADIQVGRQRWAYIKEHGKIILSENAIEQLQQI